MEGFDSSLILTKLRAPRVRPRSISRAHILERLKHELGADLVLVCAPAGYGKTTFLAEWAQSLRESGVAVAWVALDANDDDAVSFGSYLVASLAQAFGPTPGLAETAQLLRSSPGIDLQRIMPAVINAVLGCDRDCRLILDDYHLIGAPAIHSAVAFLLEHLPENLTVVLGTRSDPPLPLARLRARGRLLEVRAADLRFRPDETARFLDEVMQLDLPREMAVALEERTEGWVAGLQLAALSLAGSANLPDSSPIFLAGSHRYLVDYLLDEVVSRQTEEVQEFLAATAILERMTEPLCEAVLREIGSENRDENRDLRATSREPSRFSTLESRTSILDLLERANLFLIPLDDQGVWYRYHHLFRDFLRARLEKTLPEQVTRLHRAASEWLAAHGTLREAAAHAFQTRDWEYSAAFVERHSMTLIIHGEISTIHEWCSAFPEDVIRAHPALGILLCWPLVFRFQRQNRGKIEERLRLAEQGAAALDDAQQALDLMEHAAVVRTFLAMAPDPTADPREGLALALAALDRNPEEDAGRFSTLLTIGYCHMALQDVQAATIALETARQIALSERLYFGVIESTFHLARLAHAQGRLNQAVELCRQGRSVLESMLAHLEQELPGVGALDIALGCVLLEQNRLDEAEQALLKGLDLIGWVMNPYYQLAACVGLFRLREIQGCSKEALAFLTRLDSAWPDIAFCTRALRLLHDLRRGIEKDSDWLKEAAAWSLSGEPGGFPPSPGDAVYTPGMGPFGAAEVYYLAYNAWASVQIAIGKPREALVYLERQRTLAGSNGMMGRVIELSLLEALAAECEGDDLRAWTALNRALEAGLKDSEGFMRTFDQGPALTRLLIEAANHGIYREAVGRILKAITVPSDLEGVREDVVRRPGEGILLEYGERLSERELEVLRLMARGASNQAIAEQLVITVGTVKSHINHVLGKLSAHNRTEAVARARGLGILDL